MSSSCVIAMCRSLVSQARNSRGLHTLVNRMEQNGTGIWNQTANVPSSFSPSQAATRAIRTNLRPSSSSPHSAKDRLPGWSEQKSEEIRQKNKNILIWSVAAVIGSIGMSYAAVPLYKMFCQMTGFGGTTNQVDLTKGDVIPNRFVTSLNETKIMMGDGSDRQLRITFTGDTHSAIPWKFVPLQRNVIVYAGETALAFYKAENQSPEAITGIATYNVTPSKAGIYFNKIQCFCFEEQRLKPGEVVDMPVFFFIDPEFIEDPKMNDVYDITLSYTFFKAEDVDPSVLQAQAASAWKA